VADSRKKNGQEIPHRPASRQGNIGRMLPCQCL